MYQDSLPGAINVTLDPNNTSTTGTQLPLRSQGPALKFPSEESMIYMNLHLHNYQRNKSNPNARFTVRQTIRLPMPLNLIENYSASIGEADLGIIGGAIGAARDDISLKSLISKGKSKIDDLTKSVTAFGASKTLLVESAKALAMVPGSNDTPLKAAARITAGIVPNPHSVSLFNGIALKQHDLQWVLSPKNQSEANSIQAILRALRNAMHPRQVAATFALEYPNVITGEFKGVQNKVSNIRYSFIQQMNVDNYGFGDASFFRDGNPTAVRLTLTLKEIETLVADANGNVDVYNTTANPRLF